MRYSAVMSQRVLSLMAYLALPVVAFFAWVHPQVLDVANFGWTIDGSDWGVNTLGLAAYLRSGHWPGTATPLILAPEGTHLLMTDSNSLLGLLLKPLAPLMPAGVQWIGWWLLACLALHVTFARALVGYFIADPVRRWLGTALLTALPTLYARLPHPNLCAHWLILWALWLFVDRARSRRVLPWLAAIGIAGLVHSYLLLLVGAIWASAMLRELVQGDRRHVGLMTLLVAAELAGLVVLLGLSTPPISTSSYGAFPMPVDALFNPGNPRYTMLMPSSGRADSSDFMTVFEGFQYLGAGLIVLVVVMLGVLWSRRREQKATQDALGELRWLVPAFAVLALLAIGNVPIVHGARYVLFWLPLPVVDGLDFVRASGRLFWPVAYVIVLAAIVIVGRLPRGGGLLAIALLVQLVDIAPMFAVLRTQTVRAATHDGFRRLRDPRWPALIAAAREIEVQPPDPARDYLLLEELGWRAVLGNRPIRTMYVARLTRPVANRLAADRAAFLNGRLDPRRLYVLHPGESVPASAARRALRIDGLTVLAARAR